MKIKLSEVIDAVITQLTKKYLCQILEIIEI